MNMSKKEIPDFTQNRELSWLRFNQRVLEEARDESVPLMERMKFVAIFTSNLDEFFMIRVGSLYDLAATDDKKIDQRSGMTAKQQLDAIYRAVSPLYKERDKTYAEIKKQLHPYGVCGLDFKELEQQEKKFVKKYFKEEVLPVLSPQIVDANHPFPHLLSKEIYVVANLKQGDKAMLGIIPVPQYISNILYLPGYDIRYIRMEKIILEFAELVFNQYQVSDKNYICVTRNADVSPDDEAYADHGDFRHIMKETLHKRKKMAVVRLEAANPLSKELEKYFCEKFKIGPECIFRTKMPMKLDFIFAIADKLPESMKRTLVDEPFSPQPAAMLHEGSVMEQVKKKDVLLSYPYESMEPFLQMIREAASDPDVLTIKITIYRLAEKAMESGRPIPDNLLKKDDFSNEALWKKGVKNGCLGIGLVVCFYIIGANPLTGIGWLVFFYGLGQCIIARTTGRRKRTDESDFFMDDIKDEPDGDKEK